MKLFRFLIPTLFLAAYSVLLAEDKAKPEISLDVLRDPEVVAMFRSLPVQESGRIKPLDTVARFMLLRLSGRQSIPATDTGSTSGGLGKPTPQPLTDPATDKPSLDAKGKPITLSAIEWLLVCWFKPELAKDLRVLVVDNSDTVIALGLAGKEKRDRYSFNELTSARDTILKKMKELGEIPAKDRNPEDRAMAKLGSDFGLLAMILSHMDFARAPFGDQEKTLPADLASDWQKSEGHLGVFLPKLTAYIKAHPEAGAPMGNPWLGVLWFRTRLGAGMSDNPETLLRIFPPADKMIEVWRGPGSIIQSALQGEEVTADDFDNLSHYGELAVTTDDAAFKTKLNAVHDHFTKTAHARGESGHVTLEVSYHKADYFYNALIYFIMGLLALALSWVAPVGGWGRWCVRICALLMIVGEAYAVTGIVTRCIIMGRPPITTLYETILFITTTSVLLGLLAEWMTRKGLALAVACIAGTAGMFLSIRFMNFEGRDTMEQLQAVLITNFWLSTHVPCINLGYAAGMVACIFSLIYFIQRLFGFAKAGDARARDLTRIAYGFVMAGLFLSLVGTVLGGIWANYSWGRFWGWDPKENGALMIVLMNLVILHARLGGYVKEAGFHCCCVVLGMITVFSWFGTNQLGVGLHSYGFTDGVWKWLYIFWSSLLVFLIFGMILAWRDRSARRIKAAAHAAH
ncbi:MAG: cytochrome c biogenesis protein CcsA [Verrucomicrobiaceae bacterium]